MATYTFDELKEKYDNFSHPIVSLTVNGKDFSNNKYELVLSDIEVELTSGYEASIVNYTIYNTFDQQESKFRIKEAKSYILLGSSVELALGYSDKALCIFSGFISKVNFVYPENGIPGIRVTAMDVKGIMMANNYSRQLTATSYGEAVKEILNKNAYSNMNSKDIIKSLNISDTPDKRQAAGSDMAGGSSQNAKDRTIEMVCESDYEFVIKAAKKYNYEFFSEAGHVYFRKAKSNKETLIELSPATGLRSLDVEYDLTGLVESVQTRGMDTGKAKVITGKKKFSNKISIGNKAKPYIKKSEKIYIDPTITSQQEADSRAESILEEISYRFGTLECDCIGMPEILPGHFIRLTSIGEPPENEFYVVNVRHTINDHRGFETTITAKAASIGGSSFGLI